MQTKNFKKYSIVYNISTYDGETVSLKQGRIISDVHSQSGQIRIELVKEPNKKYWVSPIYTFNSIRDIIYWFIKLLIEYYRAR